MKCVIRLQYFIETHYNVSTRRTVLYHDTACSIAIFITAFQYLLLFDLPINTIKYIPNNIIRKFCQIVKDSTSSIIRERKFQFHRSISILISVKIAYTLYVREQFSLSKRNLPIKILQSSSH